MIQIQSELSCCLLIIITTLFIYTAPLKTEFTKCFDRQSIKPDIQEDIIRMEGQTEARLYKG